MPKILALDTLRGMSTGKAKQKQLVIKINPNVHKELTAIAKGAGFGSLEMLASNYLREVALAARSEAATLETRQAVAQGSTDLDHLKPADPAQ